MTIESDKPLKKCGICGKDVRNMGYHVANIHPKVFEKINETSEEPIIYSNEKPRTQNQNTPTVGNTSDINSMIREKLDLMLNIKIIEMLSKSPNVSLNEISAAINPPQPTKLSELKEYHDLVYGERERDMPETGNQWIDLATTAIPLIREMLPTKKKQLEEESKNVTNSGIEERSIRVLKPISEETSRDTSKSGSFSEESGTTSTTKQ